MIFKIPSKIRNLISPTYILIFFKNEDIRNTKQATQKSFFTIFGIPGGESAEGYFREYLIFITQLKSLLLHKILMMESTRQKKISALIQREMSVILQRKSSEFLNKLITVTVVRMTPDLGIAKIFLSIFPEEKNQEAFDLILENSSNLRIELGNRIRNQMRKIPEIMFYIDDSLDYADRIDELLKK